MKNNFYPELLMHLLLENRRAVEEFSNHQEKIVDIISSQPVTQQTSELLTELISSNGKILTKSFLLREKIMSGALANFPKSGFKETDFNNKGTELLDSAITSPINVKVNGIPAANKNGTLQEDQLDKELARQLIAKGNESDHLSDKNVQLTKSHPVKELVSTKKDCIPYLENWIKEQIAELIGLEMASIHSDLDLENELGLDSLRMVELWAKLSQQFPLYKPYRDCLYNASTIKELVNYLEGKVRIAAGTKKEETVAEWLIEQLSVTLGVPASSITSASHLEDDLGLDSLRIIELQEIIAKKYPSVKPSRTSLFTIEKVKDLEDLITKSILAEPAIHDFTSSFISNLKELGHQKFELTENYYQSNKVNAFQVERALSETMKDFPYLSYLKSPLLNCQTLKEIDQIVQKCPKQENLSYATKEEAVQRIIWRQAHTKVEVSTPFSGGQLLFFGYEEAIQRWKNFLRNSEGFEYIAFKNKVWVYKGEEFQSESEESCEKLFDKIDIKAFSSIIFFADFLGEDKQDLLSSGLSILQLVKSLNKYPALRKDNLQISVLIDGSFTLNQIAAGGVAKALTKEWKESKVRTIRLEDNFLTLKPERFLSLLANAPYRNDLTIKQGEVYTSELCHSEIDTPSGGFAGVNVLEDEVILILGGASGITAEISKALSQKYRCHYVCMGRTAKPGSEPFPNIKPDAFTIKDITGDEYIPLPPKKLNEKFKTIMRQKAIFETERIITAHGSYFHYVSGDGSKSEDIKKAVHLCNEIGKIAGVVHGSGFAMDSTIDRKKVEDFQSVFAAKALAAWHLYNCTKDLSTLKFVLFMSSLTSVYGRNGQADYTAANDFLNELAILWNREASYKVKALLWGVWTEAGFVKESATSLKVFNSFGLQGIKNKQGTEAALKELEYGDKEDALVVLTTPSCIKFAESGEGF